MYSVKCTVNTTSSDIWQALRHLSPGRATLLKSVELVAGLVLWLATASPGPHLLSWTDLAGPVCIALAVIFTLAEDIVVDPARWSWF